MKPGPNLLRRLSLTIFLLLPLLLQASPARKGLLNLVQPDGSLVQAFLSGDERGHLVLTPDGCSLVQDPDGWWCYARFDYFGCPVSTGVHAGDIYAPGTVLADSRDIPYDRILLRRKLRKMRTDRLLSRENARTRADESGGVRHGLIILAQFPDLTFSYTRDDFERIINGTGPETALSYFRDQWQEHYSFRFDITDIVTLPHEYAFYGTNDEDGQDENSAQMIVDACEAADVDIDFSAYDDDGDGEVDNVFVFYAGPNEAEGAGDKYIWPHMWYVQSGAGITFRMDGVLIDNYACTSELMLDDNYTTFTTLASIGTFCHEYTHTFGIPDLYDVDGEGSGGYAEAAWNCIDLMDAGNHNDRGRTPPNYSAVERWFFGIGQGIALTEGRHTLRPVNESGEYYYMVTDDDHELYLLECRNARGWDAFIGGNGLLIYHLDYSERPAGESTTAKKTLTAFERWELNEVNARPEHQCVDLVEPDPQCRDRYQAAVKNRNYEAIYALASHAFWPFDDMSVYTCDTDPAFTFWSGADSPLGLADIRRNGDGSVSFTVFNDLDNKAPAVKVDDQLVFQDACILHWSSVDPDFTGSSFIRFGSPDDPQPAETEVFPYEPGKYAYVIEGLTPSTAYKVQLLCRRGGIPGPVNANASFTTKSDRKAGSYPYIYLKNVVRSADGSIPVDAPLCLRVYNVPEANGVHWTFNGQAISPGADGFWHVRRSGTLKAVVSFPDGSTDIITKEIVVK